MSANLVRFAAALLSLAVLAACGGGEKGATPTPEATVTQILATATTSAIGTTPLPTTTSIASQDDNPKFMFEGEVVTIGFDSDWRISARDETSIRYTHKSNPGAILFTVQWLENAPNDIDDIFSTRLELLADAFLELESATIAGASATRYLSTFLNSDGEIGVVTLNLIAMVSGTAVMVTFAAPPGEFEAIAPIAEQLINTITVK